MTISLIDRIHAETDDRFIISRIGRSLKGIYHEKGVMGAGAAATAMVTSSFFTSMFSYFCLEGAVRSFVEIPHDDRPIIHVRYAGDAGGWTALPIFSLLTVGTVLVRLFREGEYINLEGICEKWLLENKDVLDTPVMKHTLYTKINEQLDAFSSQCALSKSVPQRRLKTLRILKKANIDIYSEEHRCDAALKKVLRTIEKEFESSSLEKIKKGQGAMRKRGCTRQTGSLILGVALPIILITTAVLSVVGSIGLGQELFVAKKELGDTGHFGEWPFNGADSTAGALLLFFWVMLSEGEIVKTREVYEKHLAKLVNEVSLYNRLCDIANLHLSELAQQCQYFKFPLEYKFEKIYDEPSPI